MWRLATSLTRVIGFASLTLLATSVPPSARPAMPLAKPQPVDSKTVSETPLQDADKRDRSSDPALVVSADLGNIWDKAVEVRAGAPSKGRAGGRGCVDGHHGSFPSARLPLERDCVGPVRWPIPLGSAPVRTIMSSRAFFTVDRALAPPCA
jgi:hypothetical protein